MVNGLNDRGEVVGWYTEPSFEGHGFVFRRLAFSELVIPGGSFVIPLRINNAGHIVGWYTDQQSRSHSFLWDRGYAALLSRSNAGSTRD